MEEKKEIDEDLEISLDAESEEALEAERHEERLAIEAESGEELEAQHAEQELAAGVEESKGDPPADEDEGFDLPTIESSKREQSKELVDVKETGEPFRSVPARILHAEMQMAFLDARLIVHNTFDHVTEGEDTSGMSGRVKRDLGFKDYVELVTKIGITLAIARFTSLGIRG